MEGQFEEERDPVKSFEHEMLDLNNEVASFPILFIILIAESIFLGNSQNTDSDIFIFYASLLLRVFGCKMDRQNPWRCLYRKHNIMKVLL